MANAIEYALMAGASYISNRAPIYRFPVPKDWNEVEKLRKSDLISGFEATHFTNGTQVVISFAGTYDQVMFNVNSQKIFYSHYPCRSWDCAFHGSWIALASSPASSGRYCRRYRPSASNFLLWVTGLKIRK